MSNMRKKYFIKFIFRCIVFCLLLLLYFYRPESFDILKGFQFFKEFSPLHILWVLWVFEMIEQLIPVKNQISIGSQKLFASRFRPIREKINKKALKSYIIKTTKAAYRVFLLWCILLAVVAALYYTNKIGARAILMLSALFYICDLICVLFWCPFRLIVETRCCTTCRIFNWDHLMMVSPLALIPSFFSLSLLFFALIDFLVWEITIILHPERFAEITNANLQCSECTDKLCTQNCKKLNKK